MAEEGARRLTGIVTKFDDVKGFGFIKCNKLEKELFVHQSDIKSDGFRSLSVGSTVEFVSVSEKGRLKAIEVTGPNGEPVRSKSGAGRVRETRECYNCGKTGHLSRDCQSEPRGNAAGGGGNKPGHYARDCPVRNNAAAAECRDCHQLGHFARDCPDRNSGGGDGGKCYECQQPGHFARNCPEQNSGGFECYKCQQPGHFARNCPNSNRGIKRCHNCGDPSHLFRDCPNELIE